jgi:hypothetical protein
MITLVVIIVYVLKTQREGDIAPALEILNIQLARTIGKPNLLLRMRDAQDNMKSTAFST